MRRSVLGLLAIVVLVGASFVAAGSAGAARKPQCERGSDEHAGRCFTVGTIVHTVKVVEAVPLNNTSNHVVHAKCDFTQEITKEMSTSQEVQAGVKAELFDFIGADTSYKVTKEVKQSAKEATTAGGSVTLQPGQHIVCERTYGSVSSKVKVYEWDGNKSKHYTVTTHIPSYLGATFTN
jgi:3-hydroxyacyl-CoA dehydrogenase